MHDSQSHHSVCVLSALLMVLSPMVGCNMNPAPGGDSPPEIPPRSTFVIDFGNFAGAGGSGGDGAARVQGSLPGGHWLFAAGTVGVWNVIITVTLVVPVAAFLESFNHTPEAQPDGSWAWSYSFFADGATHSARLTAAAVEDGIAWNMIISKEGEFSEVLWFTGESNLTGTQGFWMLNRDPQDLTPFIRIDWQRAGDGTTGDIRYTNIVPDGPQNGGFIYYGITSEEPFDVFYEVFNASDDVTTDIEWNRMNRDGRVMNANHFGDTDWHCWDEGLQNVECP